MASTPPSRWPPQRSGTLLPTNGPGTPLCSWKSAVVSSCSWVPSPHRHRTANHRAHAWVPSCSDEMLSRRHIICRRRGEFSWRSPMAGRCPQFLSRSEGGAGGRCAARARNAWHRRLTSGGLDSYTRTARFVRETQFPTVRNLCNALRNASWGHLREKSCLRRWRH